MNSMFAIVAPGAPRHRHAVARRDIGIGCVEINLPATAGREHETVGPNGFHLAGDFIEHVSAQATIFRREAELAGGDQIDRHVILQQLDLRLCADARQQRGLDLKASHVVHMEDAPLRVAAFAPEIQLAMTGNIAARRNAARVRSARGRVPDLPSPPSRPPAVAKTRAGLERVLNMQLKGILAAGHAGDAALRPGGVRVDAFAFRDDRDPAVLRRLQRKSQPRDAAPDDDEIEFLHPSRMLSIRRVARKRPQPRAACADSIV